jgi:hypothetical protein
MLRSAVARPWALRHEFIEPVDNRTFSTGWDPVLQAGTGLQMGNADSNACPSLEPFDRSNCLAREVGGRRMAGCLLVCGSQVAAVTNCRGRDN